MTDIVTFTGLDRPGLTARLLDAFGECVLIRDVEQLVVQGHLVLSLALDGHDEEATRRVAEQLDLDVDCTKRSAADDASASALVMVMSPTLQARDIAVVAAGVAESGGNIERIVRTADYPVTAIEITVSAAPAERLKPRMAQISAERPVDIAVQSAQIINQGARLVVMDVDSTLIRDEVIDLLAREAGCEQQVAEVTERAMAGELDFGESLTQRVAALAGTPASAIDEVRQAVRLTPGARTLCHTLTSLGYRLALVSGGFEEIVGPLAADLGVHRFRANRLEVQDGHLTGRVVPPIVDRAGKAAALREFADEFGFDMSRTVAIGDGANDLDMLATAGLGVAFNAKPAVAAAADASVNVPYLDSVLYLLGITREQVSSLTSVRSGD